MILFLFLLEHVDPIEANHQ
ncbi:hypothetical protein EE612_029130 [Oryza sativa]|nr:hypothetical protein EE612_029130 [Oryza sativa]